MVDWDRVRRKRNPWAGVLYFLSLVLAVVAVGAAVWAMQNQTVFGQKVLIGAKACAFASFVLGICGRIARSLD